MCIVVSLLSKPVDRDTLISFYRTIRPFGVWGTVKEQAKLTAEELAVRSENARLTVFNVVVGMVAVSGLYLAPMYFVGHLYVYSAILTMVAVVSIVVLKYTWYENLPK